MLLFSFASLTVNTLRLLRCVHLEAYGVSVLYYAGGQKCTGTSYWAVSVLLAVIVALPSWFVIVAMLQHLPGQTAAAASAPPSAPPPLLARVRCWARSLHMPQSSPTLQEVRYYACEPFTSRYWFWTPLLALQRCVTVMWMTFTTEDSVAAVGVSLISLFFLVVHVFARPYRTESSNFLQAACLTCLTAIAISGTVSSTLSNSGTYTRGTPLEPIVVGLDVAMAVLLAAPFAVFLGLHRGSAAASFSYACHRPDEERDEDGSGGGGGGSNDAGGGGSDGGGDRYEYEWEGERQSMGGGAAGEMTGTDQDDAYSAFEADGGTSSSNDDRAIRRHLEAEVARLRKEGAQKQQQLEAESAQKQQQLEAEVARLQQLEAESAQKQKQLEAESAQKQQQLEAEVTRLQQCEAESAQKQQQHEAENTRLRQLLEEKAPGQGSEHR